MHFAICLLLVLQAWLAAGLKVIHPDLAGPDGAPVGAITRPYAQEIVPADSIYTIQWTPHSTDGGPFLINLWGAPGNNLLQTIGTGIDYPKGEFQWPVHLEQYATLYFITIEDGAGSVREKSDVFTITSPVAQSPARLPLLSDGGSATTLTTSVILEHTSPVGTQMERSPTDAPAVSVAWPITSQGVFVTSSPTIPSTSPTDDENAIPSATFSNIWSRTRDTPYETPITMTQARSSTYNSQAWQVGMTVGLVMVCLLWGASMGLAYFLYRKNRCVERPRRPSRQPVPSPVPQPDIEGFFVEEEPERAAEESAAPANGDVGVAKVIQLRRISFKEPEASPGNRASQGKRSSVTFVE